MMHHFDIEIAKIYGVNESIFLNNLSHWIQKNIANRVHFHEETFWTYNSQPAFLELFPYWTAQTLKTVIKNCLENGLIKINNFNEKKYDRTSWYCLTEKGLSLFNGLKDAHDKAVLEKKSNIINIGENQPMDRLKSTDASVKTNRPIPDINTDIKPNRERDLFSLSDFEDKSFDFSEKEMYISKSANIQPFFVFEKFKSHLKKKGVEFFTREDFKMWLLREVEFKFNSKVTIA